LAKDLSDNAEYLSIINKNFDHLSDLVNQLSFWKIASSTIVYNKNVFSLSIEDRDFILTLQSEIDKHISDKDFSIESLSTLFPMSRSGFFRKIKTISGLSPSNYLAVYRLNKAISALQEGNLSLLEICAQTGFCNTSYFIKCFRQQFGCTPGEYISKIT
jgi:AraC-like DNA-binding protein